MSVPTTDEVREAAGTDGYAHRITPDEFAAWLAEHDRKVLYDYLSTKEVPVVRIECAEQIAWLQPRHDREVAAKAWDEGYNASDHEAYHDGTHGRTDNPYRETGEAR